MNDGEYNMVIGIILILLGIFGILAGFAAFGDIGVACGIAGFTALLSGINAIITSRKIKSVDDTTLILSSKINKVLKK